MIKAYTRQEVERLLSLMEAERLKQTCDRRRDDAIRNMLIPKAPISQIQYHESNPYRSTKMGYASNESLKAENRNTSNLVSYEKQVKESVDIVDHVSLKQADNFVDARYLAEEAIGCENIDEEYNMSKETCEEVMSTETSKVVEENVTNNEDDSHEKEEHSETFVGATEVEDRENIANDVQSEDIITFVENSPIDTLVLSMKPMISEEELNPKNE
ncbi:unnamed protein product [Cochlearia groenlandica]